MPRNRTIGSLALSGYDDIFGGKLDDKSGEHVAIVPIAELHPPEFHPFGVNDDTAMERLVRSVKQYGVREPVLARPRDNGGYELLAGNRRKHTCALAGLDTMPVIIRNLDDDADAIDAILSEGKKPPKVDKEIGRWRRFFPADYAPSQIDKVITEPLSVWQASFYWFHSPQSWILQPLVKLNTFI